jgi:hypothetical protein
MLCPYHFHYCEREEEMDFIIKLSLQACFVIKSQVYLLYKKTPPPPKKKKYERGREKGENVKEYRRKRKDKEEK